MINQHIRFGEKQQLYQEEREDMIKQITQYQLETNNNLEKIKQANDKERINMQLLEETNKDLESRLASLDESLRKLIETCMLAKIQQCELDRILAESQQGLPGQNVLDNSYTYNSHSPNSGQLLPGLLGETGLVEYQNQMANGIIDVDAEAGPSNSKKIYNILLKEVEIAKQTGAKLDEKLAVLQKKREKQLSKLPDSNLSAEIDVLKEKIICNLCRKNDKNAILTNCKHLFCIDCLRERYESRQRQCPKCGQKFGLREFREINM